MSRFHVNLPGAQFPSNAMLNFDPLSKAIGSYKDAQSENAMFSYKQQRDRIADQRAADATAYSRGRDALQDARYADELQYNRGRQGVADQRAAEQHGWERDDQQTKKRQRALADMAGLAQTIMDSPEQLRGARYEQFRRAIPDFDADMSAAGFDPNNWEVTLPALVAKAGGYKDPTAQGSKYGVSPVYGVDPEGRPVVMQLGNDGSVKQPELPQGVTPLGPGETAEARATGTDRGKAKAGLPAVIQNANQMLGALSSLKSDPYLPRMLGPIDSRTPDWSSDAGRVASKMDQIGGQAFLTAFESLKGGGQITEIEGLKATQAITRITQRNMSPEDYAVAIDELEAIVKNGVIRARVEAGELPQSALGDLRNFGDAQGPSANDPLGIR